MNLSDVEWILTQDTYVRAINEADHDEDQIVMVWDSEFRHSVILRYGPRNNNPQIMALTFNGEFVDVGDELPRYLGIMDEAVENGPGEILLTVEDPRTVTWCEAGACQATESWANSVCCENCGTSLFGKRHQVIEEDSVTYSLCESCAK